MANVTTQIFGRRLTRATGIIEFSLGLFYTFLAGHFLPNLMNESWKVFRVSRTSDISAIAKVGVVGVWLGGLLGCCIIAYHFVATHRFLNSTNLNIPLAAAMKYAKSWLLWNVFLVFLMLGSWIIYSMLCATSGFFHAGFVMQFLSRLLGDFCVKEYIKEMEYEAKKSPLPITVPKDKQSSSPVPAASLPRQTPKK